MKKILLTAAVSLLALVSVAPSSQAYETRRPGDYRNGRNDRFSDYRQLRAELYQLDLQFSRVDAYLHHSYGRQMRWQYSRLLRDRQRLALELERRPIDRFRVRSHIDRIRDQLREIEVRLRYSHRRW